MMDLIGATRFQKAKWHFWKYRYLQVKLDQCLVTQINM